MRRLSRMSTLISILALPPIPLLWFGWSFAGNPEGFAAVMTILLSYGGWLTALGAFAEFTGIPWRDWFSTHRTNVQTPAPQATAPQPIVVRVEQTLVPLQTSVINPLFALHSLLSPPRDFTGRADELNQLLKNADNPNAIIIGLCGMGGVGKTALALVVAHRVAEKYPDAQVYLDLKGTSTTPLTPTDAMKHVIHAFEPQADLRQASDDEIAALYRGLLNGKRALLFFDNASGASQVRPLVPPSTCALLVTSRKYFTLPGLQPIRLDVMSEADARGFLLKLCPRIDGHADVSVETYTARLKNRKGKRIGLLKKEDEPDLNVEAAFALSYDQLTNEKRKHWCALAVFPASFDTLAAVSVWGIEEPGAQENLSEFYRANIVQFDKEKQRYQLHDLLREFARPRLRDNERATVQLRHAQYFVRVAGAADQLYLQGKVPEGLALFDVEWENIKAGQAWAAENFEAYEPAAQLCNEYPAASAHCLHLRVAPKERIDWLESAIKAARKLGDRRREGYHLGDLGIAYANLGETGKAIEFFEQALAISRAVGDRHAEGDEFGNLGNAYAYRGETRKALEFHEHALAIARAIGDRRGEAIHLGNLGLAYADLGDRHSDRRRAIEFYEQAIEFYEQAHAIARTIGDRTGEANALGNLGDIYARRDETHKAIEFHERALDIAVLIGDRSVQGNQLGNLGLDYGDLGKTEKAIEFMEQALKFFDVIESPRAQSARRHLERLKRKLPPKPSPREGEE